MDFVKFLNDNSLRKKEIAEYLEVVPSVVSDISPQMALIVSHLPLP